MGLLQKTKEDCLLRDSISWKTWIMMKLFSPIPRLEAIRLFLTFSSLMKFKVFYMNVKTAFLHGDLP